MCKLATFGELLASAPFTSFRLEKFGWDPFADLRLRRLATKENAKFTEGGKKLRSNFCRLWAKIHEILGQCRGPLLLSNVFCPIVYGVFRSEDIRR